MSAVFCLLFAMPGFAYAGTITVGYYEGSPAELTQANEIDLGTVDLSTVDPDAGELVVSRRVGVRLAGFNGTSPHYPELVFGSNDATTVDSSPDGAIFNADGFGNGINGSTVTGVLTVSFDAARYSAGVYRTHLQVFLPGGVADATPVPTSANDGALQVTGSD